MVASPKSELRRFTRIETFKMDGDRLENFPQHLFTATPALGGSRELSLT